MRDLHRSVAASLLLTAALSLACGAQPAIRKLPAPADSGKLRVLAVALESGTGWKTPYAEYVKLTMPKIVAVWEATGIYELVPEADVAAAVGEKRSSLRWKADSFDLLKRVAEATWARYAMVVERSNLNGYRWTTTLVNVRTGASFSVSAEVPGGSRASYQPVIKASYEKLFSLAKADILSVARDPSPAAAPQPRPAPAPIARAIDLEAAERAQAAAKDLVPVAVNEMDAGASAPLVAKVLTEALRFELAGTGKFKLVSREAMGEAMKEMELQLSGAADESQAVELGKFLSARQLVLGSVGSLGSLSLVQAKRVDVATLRILAAGTIKCPAGKEEDLLDAMPALAAALSAGE